VVQARPAREAGPQVTALVQDEPGNPLGTVGLLRLGDAPRAPGTGQWVSDALCEALKARGAECRVLTPSTDAARNHLSGALATDTQLVGIGRESGVELAITGRVTLLDVETDWLPDLVVWRPGVAVDVPAGRIIRTNLVFQLRAVSIETGQLLCSAQVRHGPVEQDPEQAVAAAAVASLNECFGVSR